MEHVTGPFAAWEIVVLRMMLYGNVFGTVAGILFMVLR
jgi:hypothetical protein